MCACPCPCPCPCSINEHRGQNLAFITITYMSAVTTIDVCRRQRAAHVQLLEPLHPTSLLYRVPFMASCRSCRVSRLVRLRCTDPCFIETHIFSCPSPDFDAYIACIMPSAMLRVQPQSRAWIHDAILEDTQGNVKVRLEGMLSS